MYSVQERLRRGKIDPYDISINSFSLAVRSDILAAKDRGESVVFKFNGKSKIIIYGTK